MARSIDPLFLSVGLAVCGALCIWALQGGMVP